MFSWAIAVHHAVSWNQLSLDRRKGSPRKLGKASHEHDANGERRRLIVCSKLPKSNEHRCGRCGRVFCFFRELDGGHPKCA
jgi:hypothetical protein